MINAKFFKSVDGNALSLSYLTAIHPKKKKGYLTASTPLIISRIWSISSVWFVEDKDKNLMASVRERGEDLSL